MSRARISKLSIGTATGTPFGKHRSVAGSVVIADYIDPATGQRTLVLERQQRESKPKPRKSKATPELDQALQESA